MKKILLGAILTAGAMLAQSTGTAPANSGAKSGPAATGTSQAKPAVKRHRKSTKPVAATKSGSGSSSSSSANKAPANSGTPASK